jgi:hypothetical protein
LAVCSTVHLYAQEEGVPTPAEPETTVESPSDIPVAPEISTPDPVVADPIDDKPVELAPIDDAGIKWDKPMVSDGCCCGCGTRCGIGGGLLACCPNKGWKLPQPCLLQRMGIAVGGWLQQGVTFNAESPASGFNGPVATNDMDTKYQMNQLWLFLHRPADTGGCGWAIGGHLDMIYGTDWRFGVNHGLEDRINGFNGQDYGLVIPQAYLEVAFNNLSVKLGHMAAILDYEVIPAPMNPFYSHSYSYGYTVPQLVTGVLADYKLSDQLSIQAGFHRGWFMFEDYNGNLDFMGGIKWAGCDKRTSIAFAVSTGRQTLSETQPTLDDQNRFVYSFVLQHKLTERLKYVLVQNSGVENDLVLGGQPVGDAEWYGLNQYFAYTINPCWTANLRVEWLRDDDGLRVIGPGVIPGVQAWGDGGYAGHFYNVTAGVSWRPNGNWLVRPEVRWDWYDGQESPFPGVGALPFDDGASDNQFTFAVDAILTY